MAVVATGRSRDGDQWELHVEGDRADLTTTVHVTTSTGVRLWGVGCAGPLLQPGRRLNSASGSNDVGPTSLILRVSDDVHRIVVALSDGTHEAPVLHGDSARFGGRVGVVVHHRGLEIHRIDLFDRDGDPLPDDVVPDAR